MFSGITRGLYPVVTVEKKPGLITYTVRLSESLVKSLQQGDSVSVDGVCQTVVKIDNLDVTFNAIQETLDKTTLQDLYPKRKVSIETSLKVGDSIGGHEVSGHVNGTAEIKERLPSDNNLTLGIQCKKEWMKYILPKGFIALEGSSLTVGETHPEQGLFYIHLIPETLRLTNFGNLNIGDKVNLELDSKTRTIVDTVENYLNAKYK